MSRYNSNNGGSSNGDNDYDDDITLKLKTYSTLRMEPQNTNAYSHGEFGTSFIQNYDNAEILDGIVLQREDKPNTWNVYSADKFFNLNPEDGRVYENYDEEAEEYSNEMSAQDILEHPRVAGHSTSGGNDDYYFTPVGVVIEEAGDIAIAEDADVEATDEPALVVGDASMMLSNSAWARTYAKKMTEEGEAVINDNDEDPTPRGEEDKNPKFNDFEWLATEDPTLRDELEGRTLELWVTRETQEWDDGTETTYTVPNLMDVKTGNFVTIDNGIGGGDDTDADESETAAADGGTTTQPESRDTDTESTESTDSPDNADSGLPEDVPDALDDLIDYMARNGETTADEIREFAEDEVDDPDEIDWEAAANEANQRAN